MTEAFSWVIRSYGQKMTCYDASGKKKGSGMAIVQPMTEADWQYTAGALGSFRNDRFLCLSAPDLPISGMEEGSYVTWNGGKYEIMTVRPVLVSGVTTHLWMALRPAEERAL